MFSKLCKNAIFPMNFSSNNGNSSSSTNSSNDHNNSINRLEQQQIIQQRQPQPQQQLQQQQRVSHQPRDRRRSPLSAIHYRSRSTNYLQRLHPSSSLSSTSTSSSSSPRISSSPTTNTTATVSSSISSSTTSVLLNSPTELDLSRREPPPPYWVHQYHRRPHSSINTATVIVTTPPQSSATVPVLPQHHQQLSRPSSVGVQCQNNRPNHQQHFHRHHTPLIPQTTTSSDSSDNGEQQRDWNLLSKNDFCPDLLHTCQSLQNIVISTTSSSSSSSSSSSAESLAISSPTSPIPRLRQYSIQQINGENRNFNHSIDSNHENQIISNIVQSSQLSLPSSPSTSSSTTSTSLSNKKTSTSTWSYRRPTLSVLPILQSIQQQQQYQQSTTVSTTSLSSPAELSSIHSTESASTITTTIPSTNESTIKCNIPTKSIESNVFVMGQTLSQRRPRLSLTWVLREQQSSVGSANINNNNNNNNNNQHQTNVSSVSVSDLTNVTNSGINSESINHSTTKPTLTTTVITNNKQPTEKPTSSKLKFRSKSKNCTERLFSEKYVQSSDDEQPNYRSKSQISEKVINTTTNVIGVRDLMFTCSKNVMTADEYDDDDDDESDDEYDNKISGRCNRYNLTTNRKSTTSRSSSKLSFKNNLNNNNHFVEKTINSEKLLYVKGTGIDDVQKSIKSTYSEPLLMCNGDTGGGGGGGGGVGGGGSQHQLEQNRRHRHRRKRERSNRSQRFGYEIKNVDDFLSKCSLSSPGNIPVVLSSSSTLYQTRPGGYQIEIALPLGMVVNAIFKNQNWLYVQTPHAEEGYVGYTSCLPLGILPQSRPTSSSKPQPCWETNGDVFPKPCGNMTDSEKEIQLRGGTRSEGARTPRLRRLHIPTTSSKAAAAAAVTIGAAGVAAMAVASVPITSVPLASGVSNKSFNSSSSTKRISCGEQNVDVLYLRATSTTTTIPTIPISTVLNNSSINNISSQPKLTDKSNAQLKPTTTTTTTTTTINKCYQPKCATVLKSSTWDATGDGGGGGGGGGGGRCSGTSAGGGSTTLPDLPTQPSSSINLINNAKLNDEYVLLQIPSNINEQQNNSTQLINQHHYYYHHHLQQQQQQQQHQQLQQHQQQQIRHASSVGFDGDDRTSIISAACTIPKSTIINNTRSLLRQTLVAITENFISSTITVRKGDVVTLLACRNILDKNHGQPIQWFYVRARDGSQGYIPAEVAGHGFL